MVSKLVQAGVAWNDIEKTFKDAAKDGNPLAQLINKFKFEKN